MDQFHRKLDFKKSHAICFGFHVAITALKKGAYLLKYGHRGKPKFCPFRLSNDETALIWYSGKDEKQLKLSLVSRIIPGQRTANFRRYPRPEKEYQSFSLICNDSSLDLICKDKDEAEVWFTGLWALLSIGPNRKWNLDCKNGGVASSSDASSPIVGTTDSLSQATIIRSPPRDGIGRVQSYSDLNPLHLKNSFESNPIGCSEYMNTQSRVSLLESVRASMSSAFSSSSQGSGHDDGDALGDVYMWGEGVGDGYLGGGRHKIGQAMGSKMDALSPKALDSTMVLDVQYVDGGGRHAALLTKQGEVFCWGEECGGRLGHGVNVDMSHPKLVQSLSNTNVELVACGEYHTCAVSVSGELYTWGNGTHNFGLLGHGDDNVSHWIPKRIIHPLEGLRVSSLSCGPWHTALITSLGQLFTFGDGAFGVLGHGNTCSIHSPKEVESLKGLRSIQVACGVWHTVAVVEVMVGAANDIDCSSTKLFSWGDGDKGRLGHGDKEQKLVPTCIAALVDYNFRQVACGHSLTVALTTSGHVFTMGSSVYGQLGDPQADGKTPVQVKGKIRESFVEGIACGAFHVAVLTSKTEVYTWGKGANGRLGHGDIEDRNMPTLVKALRDKQVKAVSCGSSFTLVICLHKWVSGADQSMCSGCRLPFGFTRKRHNCYNCGLVFCHACTSNKALKASLAPNPNKRYRVCDPCSLKLKKAVLGEQLFEMKEKKEKTESKQQQLSKLTSLDQFKLDESKSFSRRNRRAETLSSRASPVQNGFSQWGVLSGSSSVHLSFGPSRRLQSASVPHSRIASRASSPVSSRRPSPPQARVPSPSIMDLRTIDEKIDKKSNVLNRELQLGAQVDSLTCRCQLQEVELKRMAHQLQEAISIAKEESAKCNAAKEVIKSLTAQLKDMAERIPGGIYGNARQGILPFVYAHGSNEPRLGMESLDLTQNIQKFSRLDENVAEVNIKSSSPLCNGSLSAIGRGTINRLVDYANRPDAHQRSDNARGVENGTPNEQEESVVQDEPGVYITLTSLPRNAKDLKRVRFSRKKFTEKQAELWWQENKARVHEQYNICVVERPSSISTETVRAEEEERIPSEACDILRNSPF